MGFIGTLVSWTISIIPHVIDFTCSALGYVKTGVEKVAGTIPPGMIWFR